MKVLSCLLVWMLQVSNAEEAGALLAQGGAARQTAETGLNKRSSRSHCCLCIRVRGACRVTGEIACATSWAMTALQICCRVSPSILQAETAINPCFTAGF